LIELVDQYIQVWKRGKSRRPRKKINCSYRKYGEASVEFKSCLKSRRAESENLFLGGIIGDHTGGCSIGQSPINCLVVGK
jgi:hypothetical protein